MKKRFWIFLAVFLWIALMAMPCSAYFLDRNSSGEQLSYETSPAAITPIMDGIISEGEYTQIRYDPENDISVALPDESFLNLVDFGRNTLYMSYDDTYVYVAATTTAENFHNGCDNNIGNMWGQHCLQLGFADINDDNASMRLEIGYGLSSDTGNLLHCVWNDGQSIGYEDEIVPRQDYIVVKDGGVLVYECRIPYEAFCASKPTDCFRFCAVWATGISKDDWTDQYIHTQLAYGCTGDPGKDVRGFAVIRMSEPLEPEYVPPFYETSPAAVTPTLDGVISTDEYTQIEYNPETDINFAYYGDWLAEYLEPEKNTVYMSYDDTYVYVAATTTANRFHNAMDENPGGIWGQYCIQLSFADIHDDNPDSRLEVGYALSSETGNLLFANWCDGRRNGYDAVPGEDFVVVNRDGILTYEARVPFSAFTVGESIENIRFAIVWATGQNTDLLIHTQLAGGITGDYGKDVTKHAVISLTSPVSIDPVVINPVCLGSVPKVDSGDILVDAEMDGAYEDALSVDIGTLVWGEETTTTGKAYMLWTEGAYYLYARVFDETVLTPDEEMQRNSPWCTDSVELLLNFAEQNESDVHQYRVDVSGFPSYYRNEYGDVQAYGPEAAAPYFDEYAAVRLDDGYAVEMKINFSAVGAAPKAGDSIGIQLQVNDMTEECTDGITAGYDLNDVGVFNFARYDYVTLGGNPVIGSCGENAVYTLAGSRLTVSGEGAVTVPFDQLLNEEERLSVRSVVVEEGITELGSWTFRGFENMTEIQLPDSLKLLAPFCFNCCRSLPSVKLPPNTVLDFPFVDCGVRYVDTGDSNLYVVEGDVLYTADYKELVLDFNDDEWFVTVPEGVEIIRPYAYYAHHEIQRLILPESLKGIYGGAFGYCEKLNFVVIPKNVVFTDSFFGDSFFADTIVFEGNAPHINGYFSAYSNMTVYYDPDTEGWDTAFDDLEFADWIANTINLVPLKTGGISYGVPVLDGGMDALYLNSSVKPLQGDNILWLDDGRDDLTVGGESYLLWDETHIYAHISVTDEEVCDFVDDDSGNCWRNDMVELWFMLPDESGNKKLSKIQAAGTGSYMNCVDESSGGYEAAVLFDIGASEVFRTGTDGGYVIELALKLADGCTLHTGDIIGYSMQLNDLDSDGLLCVGSQNPGCELYTLTGEQPAQVPAFETSPAAVTPTLDGVISADEYTQICYNPATDINFMYYEDWLAGYLEPDKNTVYMSYDDTYVYVAATTTANRFHNAMDENPGDIWGQYCIQLSFADVSNDDPDSRLEVGYALSSVTQNLLFANWCDGRGTGYNAVPGEDFVVVNRDGILTYEARVPFSAFTVGESIENIRFAIVWATGQGEGQDTYLLLHTQLASGITGADGKDVTKHAVISLTEPVEGTLLSGDLFGSEGLNDSTGYEKAFDNDVNTFYQAAESSEDMGVGIRLAQRTRLTRVEIDPLYDTAWGIRVEGSLDGETWVTLYTLLDSYGSETVSVGYDRFDAEVRDHGFTYFRVSNAKSLLLVPEVRFYGVSSDDTCSEIYRTMDASDYYARWEELGYIGEPMDGFYDTENGVFIVQAAVSAGADDSYVIPAEIGGNTVLGICQNAFRNLQAKTVSADPDGDLTYLPCSVFVNCPNLEEVTLYKSILYIRGGAFIDCPRLKAIHVPDYDTDDWRAKRAVEGRWGGEIFDEDGVLFVLNGDRLAQYPPAREGKTYTVRPNIWEIEERSFYRADNLEHVELPDNRLNVCWRAFENCSNLRSVTVWKDSMIVRQAFYGCTNLSELVCYGDVFVQGKDDFEVFSGANALTVVCDKNAVLPEYANPDDEIPIWTYVQKLINEDIQGIKLEQVPMRWNYIKPAELDYDHNDADAVKYFNSFAEDEIFITGGIALKEISTLPKTIDGYRVAGVTARAFEYNPRLKGDFIIPEGVRFIGWGAFEGTGIETVSLPSTLDRIEPRIFSRCLNLSSISVSASNPAFYSDGKALYEGEWEGHDNTLWVYAPANDAEVYTVRPECRYIQHNAFFGASHLKEIRMPDSLWGIWANAFENCSSLENVVIPPSLWVLGERVFSGCTALQTVTLKNGRTDFNTEIWVEPDSEFFGVEFGGESGRTLYVYAGTRAEEWLGDKVPHTLLYADSALCATFWNGNEIELTHYILPKLENGSVVDRLVVPEEVMRISGDLNGNSKALKTVVLSSPYCIIEDENVFGDAEIIQFEKYAEIEGIRYGLWSSNAAVLDWVVNDYPSVEDCITEEDYQNLKYEVTIPSQIEVEGKIYTVTAIGEFAFGNDTACKVKHSENDDVWYDDMPRPLVSVEIPDTVTYIGSQAFEWVQTLKEVTMPVNPVYIGWSFTNQCSSLETIKGLTPYAEDNPNRYQLYTDELGGQAVIDTQGYRLIAYSKGNPAEAFTFPKGLKSIEDAAFGGAVNLRILNIPEGIQTLENHVIMNMARLETLTLPSTLREIYEWGNISEGCPNLRNVIVAPGNTSFKVVDGVVFTADGKELVAYPAGLDTSYTIPYGTEIIRANAFCRNEVIESIIIPETVTSIGQQAFCGTTMLHSLTLPSGLTVIPRNAFANCDNLETVFYRGEKLTIQAVDGDIDDWVRFGRYDYENADSKTTVVGNVSLDDNLSKEEVNGSGIAVNRFDFRTWEYWEVNNYVVIKDMILVKYNGQSTTPDLSGLNFTAIAGGAFENTGVTSVTFPDTLTTIYCYAFDGISFKDGILTIPEGVTTLCDNALTNDSIRILNLPSTLQSAELSSFDCLRSLETITLADGNTHFKLENGALLSADGTILYKVPQAVTAYVIPDTVEKLGVAALYGCRNITGTFRIPAGVNEIGSYALSDLFGVSAFACEGNAKYSVDGNGVLYQTVDGKKTLLWYPLAKTDAVFTIPSDVKILGWDCFYANPYLKSVTLPEGLEEIGNFAFEQCQALIYVNIPKVTKLGVNAFYGCTTLSKIDMPSIQSIDEGAFSGCTNLTSAMVGETKPEIHKTAFDGTPAAFKLYFPKDTGEWEGMQGLYTLQAMWNGEEGAVIRAKHYVPQSLVKGNGEGKNKITMVLAPDSVDSEEAVNVELSVIAVKTETGEAKKALDSVSADAVVISTTASYDIAPEVDGNKQSSLDAPATITIPLWEGYDGDGSNLRVLHEHNGITEVAEQAVYDPENHCVILDMDQFSVVTLAEVIYETDEPDDPDDTDDPNALSVNYMYTCSFNNDLTLNYYIAADELDGCTDIVLNLTREYYDGGERRQKNVEIPAQLMEAEESKIGKAAYKFSYSGIAACEIGDVITAKVTAVKDGKPVSGQEDRYSVKQYAYSRLEKTDNADFRTLLVDLLNYAAEAQKYFNYDTGHLVNADLTYEQKAYGTAELPEIHAEEKLTDIGNPVVEFYAKSCVFNSNVELKYYLSIPEGESTDGMYIRFRYMPTKGNERVIDIPASEFQSEWIRKKNSATEQILCRTVKLTDIAAPDMGKTISAQVFRGDGTPLSDVLEYSIEAYAKSRLENSADESFRSLIGAMLKYTGAANTYFNPVK